MKQSKNPALGVAGLAMLVASVVLVTFLTSCGNPNQFKLTYRNITPASEMSKKVSIGDVTDSRDAKTGGKNPVQVGVMRNGYGMPFAIDNAGREPIAQFFKDMLNDASKEVGLDVVTTDNSAPVLSMDVTSFWCDGYSGIYKVDVALTVKLSDANGTELASKEISFQDGFTIVWSQAEIGGHYKRIMTKLLGEVESVLKSGSFKSAL